MHQRITEELSRRGVLSRREFPGLAGQIDRAVRDGELVRVVRGVYALPVDADRLRVRAGAIVLTDPNAVVCGEAAAVLHGWFSDEGQRVDVASQVLRPSPWLRPVNRQIPAGFTRLASGIRCTSQAMTALDLVPTHGAEIIDQALRRRVRLADLEAALAATPHRRGNRVRAEALRDSRHQPWSPAERCAHRALRAAKIDGWTANHPVIPDPTAPAIAWLDIAFCRLRLAIEIDGAEYHLRRTAFERDRARDEALSLLGWQVVRFSARRVLDDPAGFASAVAQLLRVRESGR